MSPMILFTAGARKRSSLPGAFFSVERELVFGVFLVQV